MRHLILKLISATTKKAQNKEQTLLTDYYFHFVFHC
jgi:hypothetical protein